jgi:hypothetical protein
MKDGVTMPVCGGAFHGRRGPGILEMKQGTDEIPQILLLLPGKIVKMLPEKGGFPLVPHDFPLNYSGIFSFCLVFILILDI